MSDKELAQHLTVALEIARAKFHGLAAATCGEFDVSLPNLHDSLQQGNRDACNALAQSPYWQWSKP